MLRVRNVGKKYRNVEADTAMRSAIAAPDDDSGPSTAE